MENSYSILNSTMSSTDTTNTAHDKERQPSFTTPSGTQPVFNSTPLINNSAIQRNIELMRQNQLLNLLQTYPKYGQSVELTMPTTENYFSNSVDPSMPYFVTLIPPTPGRVMLTSALSQLGLLTMKECMNMHNTCRCHPNLTSQSSVLTPFCNNHVHNASQINQSTTSKYVHQASTQTVESTETQTEEELFYEPSGMPKKKRGRRKK